ncbi:hypothetical protein PENANT_c036G01141 [Penicillium antarcticum]|uniref:MARVEL domain-containing protein n=1 Tax=Penicillium antarcticum TaxID=416450 RepID=A0A1V6PV19_9EURO|nr:uncharacterized protein N7508_002023 [Penicillium antarcticum]KAJ5317515.1 hypothetical protein N7508_002023 [Penicillium antarcticum]OQD80336.1 hypothetical protein PENANT_c036G01141 [Penicillium antarcticum]
MPVISRLVSIILRVAEIAFAAVVAGIIGHYLAGVDNSSNDVDWWPQSRWIYTEVIAGLSILLGLIWLIPFSSGFFSWPLDILISFAWFAAFGVLVDTLRHLPCGSIWSWHFRGQQMCGRWKAAEAFSFLSAIIWLVSGIVGIWFTFRVRPSTTDGTRRRRWGRSAV